MLFTLPPIKLIVSGCVAAKYVPGPLRTAIVLNEPIRFEEIVVCVTVIIIIIITIVFITNINIIIVTGFVPRL